METGLVFRSKLLKQVRQALQGTANKFGKWSKAKPIIDSVALGERNDLVMIGRSSRGLEHLVVVGYREMTGDKPKIRIVPRLAMQVNERDDDGCPIWPEAVREIIARVGEFRSIVAASGDDVVELVVEGRDDLREDIIGSLKPVCKIMPGAPVMLDGELIEGNIIERINDLSTMFDPKPVGVPGPVFQGQVLFGWSPDYGSNELKDDEDFVYPSEMLRFASGASWKAATDALAAQGNSDAGVLPKGVSTRSGARPAKSVEELKQAIVQGQITPGLEVLLPKAFKDAVEDRGSLVPVWRADGSLSVLLMVQKGVDVRHATEGEWHIGLGILPAVHMISGGVNHGELEIAGVALREQVRCDILSLAETALKNTRSVVIDVGMFSISGEIGEKAFPLKDFVEAGISLAKKLLPQGAAIGGVRLHDADGTAMQHAVRDYRVNVGPRPSNDNVSAQKDWNPPPLPEFTPPAPVFVPQLDVFFDSQVAQDLELTKWKGQAHVLIRLPGFADLLANIIASANADVETFVDKNWEFFANGKTIPESDRHIVEYLKDQMRSLAERPCHPAWVAILLCVLFLTARMTAGHDKLMTEDVWTESMLNLMHVDRNIQNADAGRLANILWSWSDSYRDAVVSDLVNRFGRIIATGFSSGDTWPDLDEVDDWPEMECLTPQRLDYTALDTKGILADDAPRWTPMSGEDVRTLIGLDVAPDLLFWTKFTSRPEVASDFGTTFTGLADLCSRLGVVSDAEVRSLVVLGEGEELSQIVPKASVVFRRRYSSDESGRSYIVVLERAAFRPSLHLGDVEGLLAAAVSYYTAQDVKHLSFDELAEGEDTDELVKVACQTNLQLHKMKAVIDQGTTQTIELNEFGGEPGRRIVAA
jgi:hypothetical protein